MDRRAMIAHVRSTAELMGISLEELGDLVAVARDDEPVPTIEEFLPRVVEVESSKRGWAKRKGLHQAFVAEFGSQPLDAVKPRDIERYAMAREKAVQAREDDRQRRLTELGLAGAPRRTGKGARRSAIEAARAFLQVAVDDGLLRDNTARKVALPRRPTSRKRALTAEQVDQLFEWARWSGDGELDTLLLWFHLETGARRAGALGLRLVDLKREQRAIALFEKGDIERLQPVSANLLAALTLHAQGRGACDPQDRVFRFVPRRGDPTPRPITKKYYERLVLRLRTELPWAQEVWTRTHDLRHTAITHVERVSGSTAVARLFAGHADRETTDSYDRADEEELRKAVDSWASKLDC
jgi:site-specific recombinase XerD